MSYASENHELGGQHVSEMIEEISIRDLHAFYGESHALHGIDLQVYQGELVTLLGRNGSGRTTTLRSIIGLIPRRTGSIVLKGKEIIRSSPDQIAHLGVGYCPEERGIFSSLNVEENLMLPPKVAEGGMSVEELYEMFPNLAERRKSQGTRLSGGEQQMLAMARILRTGANILLLDEITEGLPRPGGRTGRRRLRPRARGGGPHQGGHQRPGRRVDDPRTGRRVGPRLDALRRAPRGRAGHGREASPRLRPIHPALSAPAGAP